MNEDGMQDNSDTSVYMPGTGIDWSSWSLESKFEALLVVYTYLLRLLQKADVVMNKPKNDENFKLKVKP